MGKEGFVVVGDGVAAVGGDGAWREILKKGQNR